MEISEKSTTGWKKIRKFPATKKKTISTITINIEDMRINWLPTCTHLLRTHFPANVPIFLWSMLALSLEFSIRSIAMAIQFRWSNKSILIAPMSSMENTFFSHSKHGRNDSVTLHIRLKNCKPKSIEICLPGIMLTNNYAEFDIEWHIDVKWSVCACVYQSAQRVDIRDQSDVWISYVI